MKKTFYFLAAALLVAAASCNKEDSETVQNEQPDTSKEQADTVTLSINVSSGDTKSTSNWDEASISTLSVYVFDSNGDLSGSGTVSGSTTLDVTCTTGNGKSIYAIANKTLSNIDELSDITSATTVLTDNTDGKFVMSGWLTGQTITRSTSFSISISRAAAKITIDNVNNYLADPDNSGEYIDILVKKIFLINVPIGNYLFCSDNALDYSSTMTWGNIAGYNGDYTTYLSDEINTTLTSNNRSLNSTSATNIRTYYCYPNPTEVDEDEGESTKYLTRLVVETVIEGKTYYYPVTFENVERNKNYFINCVQIFNLGSDDPDEPIVESAASFSVTVENWNQVNTGAQNI